jgi:serine/threonine protein phosphatase PrpC
MGTPSVAITQGLRSEQEDQYCIHSLAAKGLRGWLLGVFDGHGGSVSAAEYCRRYLFTRFKPKNDADASYALGRAVKRLAQETAALSCGTTLSVACILEDTDVALIATIGDSPVIVRTQNDAMWTSNAHNVGANKNERESAERRGALYHNGYISARIDGPYLQLSRALGDADLRSILSDSPDMKTLHCPTHLVLATDGILNIVYDDSDTHQKIAQMMARKDATANTVLAWRSHIDKLRDNTTVIMWTK